MTTHSSILAWTEELGGLQSTSSQRAGHNCSTKHTHILLIGEGQGNPLQHSCLENPMDRGAWLATVHRVAQSRTRLKQQHTHTHTHTHFYLLVYCFPLLLSLEHKLHEVRYFGLFCLLNTMFPTPRTIPSMIQVPSK